MPTPLNQWTTFSREMVSMDGWVGVDFCVENSELTIRDQKVRKTEIGDRPGRWTTLTFGDRNVTKA